MRRFFRNELRKRLRQCQCGGLLGRLRGPGAGVRLRLEGEVSPVTRCVHADWVWPWPSPKSAVRGGLLTYSYSEVSSSMVGRAFFVFCSCSFYQTFWSPSRQAHDHFWGQRDRSLLRALIGSRSRFSVLDLYSAGSGPSPSPRSASKSAAVERYRVGAPPKWEHLLTVNPPLT